MGWKLTHTAFNDLITRLKTDYTVVGPRRFEKRGRFSDTDLIRYDEVASLDEIVWNEKSTFSPKEVVFPVTQTLFYFTEDEFREPAPDDRKILVFLRACDINGIRRLDTIYLGNGPQPDSYYAHLRSRLRFVLMECRESFDTCFCVSMNANTTSDYDMAVRLENDGLLIQTRNDEFSGYFGSDVPQADFAPAFISENKVKVTVPDVEDMPIGVFSHEMWNEYKSRCIACGRCNTTCVTCSCHTTTDLFHDDNRLVGERRRTWAACHVGGFTQMAGNISFRKDNGSRMRFKTLHKVYDFKKRFGEHMCVGCGRCDDNCPEYISFSNCINRLSQIM